MEIARTDNHFSLYTLQSLPTHMSDKFSFDPKICFHLFSRFDFLFWKRFNKGMFWGKAIWEGGRGSKTFFISTIGLRFNDGNRLRDFLNSSGTKRIRWEIWFLPHNIPESLSEIYQIFCARPSLRQKAPANANLCLMPPMSNWISPPPFNLSITM